MHVARKADPSVRTCPRLLAPRIDMHAMANFPMVSMPYNVAMSLPEMHGFSI